MAARKRPSEKPRKACCRVSEMLEGVGLGAVAGDLAILVALTALLLAIGSVIFVAALNFARRRGTLAQY